MGSAPTLPCLLFCILYLTAGTSAKPHFVVLLPSVIYYPYTGKVHVHLMDLDAPVRVTLHLASSHGIPDVVLEEQGNAVLQLDWPRFPKVSATPPGIYEMAYFHVSIQGGSLQVSQQKIVLVEPLQLGTLVQTDQAVYAPGQTVKFRIVRLDANLIPSNQEIPRVAVQDPNGNLVALWQEVTPRQGMVDLSFPLAAEPALGAYTIDVEGKRRSFRVDSGLPSFEVLIRLPPVTMVKDEETVEGEKIPLEVCGWSWSRRRFRGRAQARLCQYITATAEPTRICAEFRGQTQRNGCFSTEVPAAAFNLPVLRSRSRLYAYARLVEEGTGESRAAAKSCRIVYETATITFESVDRFYQPGVPCTGTMLLKATNGSALREKEFLLVLTIGEEETQRRILLTDGSGRASFELDTSAWSDKVSLHGELKEDTPGKKPPKFQSDVRYLFPIALDSRTFLKIHRVEKELPCGQPQQLQVDYFLEEKAIGSKLQNLALVFLVLAKGTIVTLLRKELPAEAGMRGSFSLELPIGPELAPRAKVLGYTVLPDGKMVADSTELKVAKCLPSKVNFSFSEPRALVGSELRLKVQADPGSLCSIYAVDQGTQLSGPRVKLNPSTVYDLLPRFYDGSYPFEAEEYDLPECLLNGFEGHILLLPSLNCYDTQGSKSWKQCMHSLQRREAPPINNEPGSATLIKDASLKIVTNTWLGCVSKLRFHRHQSLLHPTGEELEEFLQASFRRDKGIQMDFLARWLWELVPVGEGGSAEMTVMVPNASTEWEAGMFCTSPLGLGLAPGTTLTAVQPFSVELALPSAVLRHETFTPAATVSSSLRQCLRVQLVLLESAELEVLAGTPRAHSDCVCEDEAKTFQWSVRATSLGEVMVTIITETLRSEELCGTQMPVMPPQGQVDTQTQLLKVQPARVM